jgi:hypothetical protein
MSGVHGRHSESIGQAGDLSGDLSEFNARTSHLRTKR